MNKKKHTYSKAWHVVYAVQPPIRKVLQACGMGNSRKPYMLGKLNAKKYSLEDFEKHMSSIGFEHVKLAWCEDGEVLSMRRVDGLKFQWHVRVFEDGEVRGHYEYSAEGNPIHHLRGKVFQDDKDFLLSLLGDYIVRS